MLQHVSTILDATMISIDRGLALAAAARILESEADATDQHPLLANMLRVNAAALPTHPDPAMLCERNADRLNAQFQCGKEENWPAGMVATQISAAADAFFNAGVKLRAGGVGVA